MIRVSNTTAQTSQLPESSIVESLTWRRATCIRLADLEPFNVRPFSFLVPIPRDDFLLPTSRRNEIATAGFLVPSHAPNQHPHGEAEQKAALQGLPIATYDTLTDVDKLDSKTSRIVKTLIVRYNEYSSLHTHIARYAMRKCQAQAPYISSGWNVEQFRVNAQEFIQQHGFSVSRNRLLDPYYMLSD